MLSTYLVPVDAAASADYVVSFPADGFHMDINYAEPMQVSMQVSITWRLRVRDRKGDTLVDFRKTTVGPTTSPVGPTAFGETVEEAVRYALPSIMRDVLDQVRGVLDGSPLAVPAAKCQGNALSSGRSD